MSFKQYSFSCLIMNKFDDELGQMHEEDAFLENAKGFSEISCTRLLICCSLFR